MSRRFLIASGLALCVALAGAPAWADALSDRLDALVAAEKTKTGMPSITVLVRKDGKTVYQDYVGYADVEQQVPASAKTAYAIGSVTKSITAQTALRLAAQGKISLDATVASYLPDYDGPAKAVTVRQLLTHTSGLPDYAFIPGFVTDWWKEYDRHEPTKAFEKLPLQFEPGTQFRYTNSGFHLVGMIIEKVTGKPYEDAVREVLLDPYGLSNIRYGAREPLMPFRARGYRLAPGGALTNAPALDMDVALSSGGFTGTADDLARYAEIINDPAKTPQAVRDLMYAKTTMPDGTVLTYLPTALIESDFFGHKKLAHSGDIEGFQAHISYYPADKVSIVVLENARGAAPSPSGLERRVARAVLGVADPVIQDLPLTAAQAKTLTGDYNIFPMSWGPAVAVVGYSDGKLTIAFRGTSRGDAEGVSPLLNQGGGKFVAPFDNEMVVRFAGKGAKATVSFDFLDALIVAKRAPEKAQ
jgi:D-alanyl-D-alanine carboxypeptidase